MSSFDRNPTEN